ncbi:TauD/TfdA family dioxygenase [Krasilnikovia sp. MM14-A1004]|uniref:TauD/TfdA family dioxygenase n=1 Tax=Krasilnikovia sp. MM14-A1004 TaxID=3373541 RepID=UPI00399C5635
MSMATVGNISFEPGFPSRARLIGADPAPADVLTNLEPKQRDTVRELLDASGAVHFRGFGIRTIDQFETAAQSLLGQLAPYRGGDAPRRAEKGFVYNAAGPDKSRVLRAHNELSYAPWHPKTLCFGCGRPADEGGATTLIDGHRVYESLPPRIRDAFRTRGVTYIQHLPHAAGDPSGIKSWPETFETDSKDDVMELCQSSYTSAKWTPLGLLTTNRTPGTLEVGSDDRIAWFNQAHIWRKDPTITPKVSDMGVWETRLGYGATYGDGTEISTPDIEQVSATLHDCTVPVNWEAGDLLLVDNQAVMHGRMPYAGERQVFVAFA